MKKIIIKNKIYIIPVNKNKIKMINRKYKKKNKITDILTFESTAEIFICTKYIKNKKKNIKKVILHGLLHLIGYSHKLKKDFSIMKKIEKMIGMSGIEPPTTTTSK